jgi:hypothetical protein
MCILYKKSFVKKFQLGDNKPKKNSKAWVFQWFIELNPKRNQRQALGIKKRGMTIGEKSVAAKQPKDTPKMSVRDLSKYTSEINELE